MLNVRVIAILVLANGLVACPAFAASASWDYTLGADYSAGRYGAAIDTQVTDLSLGARVQKDAFRLEVALPFVTLKGPGELVSGTPIAVTGESMLRRSSVGDLGLTGSWMVIASETRAPSIELTGTIKAPTAPAGIGTARTDYALGANIYQTLTPTLWLFGSLGYSWLTDSPTYVLSNGVAVSAALIYRPDERRETGVSLAYRQPAAEGLKSQISLSPYISQRLNDRVGISFYASAGLTDASPRLGAGVALKFSR